MAQHDYNLANQSGADFRADLNNALEAIATVNSGATEPSTTFAHQLWVDTANSVLKIRNAANSDWITFGVSISSSNVFTGNLTGDVVGNVTGDLVGNVTGDLTGNADSADVLSTARTISLSGDVVGSVSFNGSADVDISTVVQINSITLGTDTTGDYVESISGGTGVTITGGTGESSTPVVAIGQAVGTGDNVTFNLVTATNEFIGDIDGAIRFTAKADEALSKGDVVYVSGVQGNTTTVGKAKADDSSKMPAFGLAIEDANNNNNLQIVTFGNLTSIDTSNLSVGEIIYVSTTAGEYTTTPPAGESAAIQNIGKVLRSHQNNGSIKVGGAGRSNATGNLNDGNIFIGNASNQAVTSTLNTSIVPENTNLYWTTARGESMFDTRLATKDTGDLAEGSNLYYTTVRVNSDFDTRLATKDTDSLSEGVSNLYYTTTRVNSDFDTRLATKDTSDLTEGSNLYYTTARVNSDFDTRLATKSTTNLAEGTNLYYTDARFDTRLATKDTDDLTEGSNLYYTTARFDSAFANKTTSDLTEGTNLYYTDARANSAIDTRVTKSFVDALNIQAASVDANSVTLGTDTVGNYIQTITGTANKITVSGSGSESADVTLTLPDDVQIADSLTVAGNLTVNGTLTSLDTTNLDIEDNLFQLNAGLTGSPVNDSGMLINRGNQDNGIFMWDESADKFTLGLTTADGSATGNITLNSLGTLVANIEGAVTGNVTGTVSDVSNHDTDDIGEGSSNLYYTDARADARVNLQTGANLDLSSKSTSDLSEGTNEYFTTARARSSISATGDIAYNSSTGVISFTASAAPVTSVNTLTGAVVLDSDDIAEGSTNLYYTDARARAAISESSTQLAYNSTTGVLTYTQGDTDTVSEGTSNLYYTTSRFDAAFSGKSTSDLSEGTNLYYTDARAQAVSINNVVEDTTPQLGGDLASNGNDINFGDNDKAIFGDGSDLQIYHDGSNSYIRETGTGDLYIQGTQLRLQSSTGESFFVGVADGASYVYHNGSAKLNTTSTGIDVTGTATMDGLTVDGDTTFNTSSDGSFVDFSKNNTTVGSIGTIGSHLTIGTSDVGIRFHSGNTRLIPYDTSTNEATNGTISLGSGTAEFNELHLSSTANVGSVLTQGGSASSPSFAFSSDLNTGMYNVGANILGFSTDGSERLRIDGSGNVGIGTSSPSAKLAIETGIDEGIRLFRTSANANFGAIEFRNSTDTATNSRIGWNNNELRLEATSVISATTNGSEAMRIDSSGNVGIGTSSPTQKLDVNGTVELNNLTIAGSQGTDGQVLTSTGSGVAWEDASGGLTFKEGGANFTDSIMVGDNSTGTLNAAIDNTGLGADVFAALTSGAYNVAVGFAALNANTTGSQNTAVGMHALKDNTTGLYNTAVGQISLRDNQTGSENTGLGYSTLKANTGSNNTAVGYAALTANTTGTLNTAIGSTALEANTEGTQNVAVGSRVLPDNTTGTGNVGMGEATLYTNTTGDYNIGIGLGALQNSNSDNNVAIGYRAMHNATSATTSVAIGSDALFTTISGSNNVGIGYYALRYNTGSSNTAMGRGAMFYNTSGNQNTAIGQEALANNTTAANNTAVGYGALVNNTTQAGNTGVGWNALGDASTGLGRNTGMGYEANGAVTTGAANTALGWASGGVTTGNGNTVIGYITTTGSTTAENRIVIGYNVTGTANNRVHLGSNGGYVYNDFTLNNTWTQTSDKRLKKNINDDDLGLSFIKEITPVTYNWKRAEEIDPEFQATRVNKGEKDTETLIHGLLAQDVKEAMDKVGNTTFNGWADTVDGQSISREMFITPLINAVKELSTQIDELKSELLALKGE